MRIAFIVNQFPCLSETFILSQITGLIDRGHEVDIYASQLGDTSKMHQDVMNYSLLDHTYYWSQIPTSQPLRSLKGLGLLVANFHKAPLVLLRSLNVFAYGKQTASLRIVYKVLPLLGKPPYNIVHCQFGTLGSTWTLLRQVVTPSAKLITSFRGYDISKCVQQSGDDVYTRLFKTGDLFLPNCKYFKHRLVKLGCPPLKTVVHGSGIDCSRFVFTPRHPPADGRVRIVTTGRLVEKKGIEYSIRAVGKLAKVTPQTRTESLLGRPRPHIEYLIIGDGPLREDLQRLIQELDVSDSVKLVGWKQQQEIIEILNHSHLFVAPSVTAQDGNQDAPVNVLKEAMAMGLPVVSTKHGGIPELVEDGVSGFLVPERDVEALAEKLAYMIEHSEDWPKLGRAGRAYVEAHYDMNKLNDQLVELYQGQLNSRIDQVETDAPMSPRHT